MKNGKKSTKVKGIVYNHIINNAKEYIIVTIIFIIGIMAGVFFINNSSLEQKGEINNYISGFITELKNTDNTVNKSALLISTIKNNIFISVLLWFMGCTVIGIPIVYAIVLYRGFALSYTISSFIATLGANRDIFFFMFFTCS